MHTHCIFDLEALQAKKAFNKQNDLLNSSKID